MQRPMQQVPWSALLTLFEACPDDDDIADELLRRAVREEHRQELLVRATRMWSDTEGARHHALGLRLAGWCCDALMRPDYAMIYLSSLLQDEPQHPGARRLMDRLTGSD